MPIVVMVMVMAVMMTMMLIFQNQRAYDIDGQSQTRDKNCLIELNWKRVNKSSDGFTGHHQTDTAQNNGAGECTQHTKFTCAKTETGVRCVSSGEEIGENGYQERRDMGSHVQTVGKQSH